MSIWGRRVSVRPAIVAAVALMLGVSALLPAVTRPPAREIVLVARGMAFYLDSDPYTPNPDIVVRAGERVRVVLRNDERGMMHDFAVPALDAQMTLVGWGERGSVTFELPESPGAYEYVCTPHRLMMSGRIVSR